MRKTKVTFIQPKYFNIWEALGVAYIIAYCKKNYMSGMDVDYYQGYFDDDSYIIQTAAASDIVAFSCTSPTFQKGIYMAGLIKKLTPSIKIVFGGFHSSALSELVASYDCVDHVVIGEGEKAFLSILEGNAERIIHGEPLSFSKLPHPDRKAIKNWREVNLCEKIANQRITSFQSVRGCPFSCVFCSERSVSGVYHNNDNPIRIRKPDDLLEEINVVTKEYRLDMFKFVDATWNISVEKVTDFCKAKIEIGNETEWECNIHAAFTSEEMFYWMKRAGCRQINVGCESGSPKILKQMKKGITVDRVIQVFDWAKKQGLQRRAYFTIGMPDETEKDILQTEELVRRIEPDVFGVTILCPYPGSDLFDPSLHADVNWSQADEYSNSFWETKSFSNHDLKKWQEYLIKKFSNKLAWHHKVIAEQ